MSRKQNQVSPSENIPNFWIETTKTIGLSLIFAFGIRTFAAQAFNVLSGSMEPTLQIDDKFIVDKVSYHFSQPKRGDIVVFSPTQELQKEQYHDAFIKRVIALPGEKVELREGKVYVNNKPLLEDNYFNSQPWTSIDVCTVGKQPPYLSGPVTIPANSYLVLGDNRINSYDGRCWGIVPRENIIGRAVVRFWPLNHIGELNK
ncbi:signal peptidase I [Hassallia byssoidea VB512170]|uniref:Signal peptidase I n=1 Tax=Hassallia byssoidea VB512170 TaxID=1304833 RepID=A0A846HFQ1_9CYAN|nr:signal peptidase I [Hassalia byssoidea]NEU75619.1 signal peptidase I [Hassalia byssoidea VB512170]